MKRSLKRILFVLLSLTLVMSLCGTGCSAFSGTKNVKSIDITTKPALSSITLKWKKQKKVSFYRVYRLDITDKMDASVFSPKRKDYRKIARVSGKARSYKDKKVTRGHCYAYFLDGYKKSKGKSRLVCTSYYLDGAYQAESAGLGRPEVSSTTDTRSGDAPAVKLFLEISCPSGVSPKGVEFYRMAQGAGKYSKVSLKSSSKSDLYGTYTDSQVTPGTNYTYKIRTYVKKGKKKYWSPYSRPLTLPAVNYNAYYTVKSMTAAGNTDQFVVKLTSHKNNGATTFFAKYRDSYKTVDKAGKNVEETAALTAWSSDGENWNNIPEKGASLAPGKTIYLKYTLSSKDKAPLYYGGDTAKVSLLEQAATDECNVHYVGPSIGGPYFSLDIAAGKGSVFTGSEG